MRAFSIPDWYRTNILSSKPSVLFLRDMVLVYGTAREMNEHHIIADLSMLMINHYGSRMDS